VAAIVVLVAGTAAWALWNRDGAEPVSNRADVATANTTSTPPAKPAAAPVSAQNQARADAVAAFGPRRQQTLPAIPFGGHVPPRPHEVVTAAYQFAAEHPEILSYIPCFCGCERSGHAGNHDCFVRSRSKDGDVIEWDEHGVECTICIDVATRSRQMFTSGASARDRRHHADRASPLTALGSRLQALARAERHESPEPDSR
jgi:hypothetical protein